MYQYKAIITDVYDGDTVTADIDLGFGVWLKGQKLRIYGIDTPELRGDEREDGLKVRDYVRELILNKTVQVKTYKDKKGKYGRWLADVIVDEPDNKFTLATRLLAENKAKPYFP